MDGLRKIVRALRAGNSGAEALHGISSAQLFALAAIDADPGGSLRDLAERTLTSQSTVSEVVSRLVTRGLVTRVPSSSDARRIELRVSAMGRQILDQAPPTVQEKLAAGFLLLPSARQRTLVTGIEAWIVAAGLSDVPAAMFFEERKELS
jgi:DNA-binding MarR family transcriptional regulator